MSLLGKIGKIAGGALGGVIGGPAGAAIGSSLGSALGGAIGSKGAKKAGSTAAAGNEQAAAEQRAALERVTQLQNPYLAAGEPAVNALMAVNSGDYSGFENSPDYLFAQQQGAKARERSAAARGGLNSGTTLAGLERFGQGLATQNLGNYRNALMGQIGIGQGATNQLSGATLNAASGVGNALIGAGDARASGIVGSTNAITGGIEDIAGTLGDYYGNSLIKKKPVSAATTSKPRAIGPY